MLALLFLFVKNIFSLLDRMVVFAIKYLYKLIIAIADTNVFGDLIYKYLGRIYLFLSIFMVFKLSISIINYVVNPDTMTDKNKGFGKLISNVVISLILLVATPNLFEVAFDLQKDILNSNAIYQIVTGKKLNTSSGNKNMYAIADANAEHITFGIYSGFIYRVANEDSETPFDDDYVYAWCESGEGCGQTDENGNVNKNACSDTNCLLSNSINSNNKYWWLLSTACGCVVAYILLGFCIDTATRSVKLGFLQIIAPVPIMLRMDPGAKDDKFQKWLQETIKTFISLFVRLAALFFAIEVITTVMSSTNNGAMTPYSDPDASLGGGGLTGVFVRLFIIIGCLLFAKQFPQLLSDLLGIKLDGDGFSLKKKMSGIPGLGAAKAIGAGALGFAGGAAANAWALGHDFHSNGGFRNGGFRHALTGKNKGEKLEFKDFTRGASKLFSVTTGGLSGAYRGATSKDKNMFKAAGAGIKGSADARNLRLDRRDVDADGVLGAARRFGSNVSNLAGIESGASAIDKEIAAYEQFNKFGDALDSYAEKEVLKNKTGAYDNVANLKNKIEALKNTGINRSDYMVARKDSAGNVIGWNFDQGAYDAAFDKKVKDITAAEKEYYKELSKAKEDFITSNTDDATVSSSIQEMQRIVEQSDNYAGFKGVDLTNGSTISASNKSVKNTSKTRKSSDEYAKTHVGPKPKK